MGTSNLSSGYHSEQLYEDARRLLDHRIRLINPELLQIKQFLQRKYPEIAIPWADEELPASLRKIEEENPHIKIPQIKELGYHSIAEALYLQMVTDPKKRARFPELTLEQCQNAVDEEMRHRETCHQIITALTTDIIGDLGDNFLNLVAQQFGEEVADTLRGTVKTALVGDEPLLASDETIADGIATQNKEYAGPGWHRGDVGKTNAYVRIVDSASKSIQVYNDDIFEALRSSAEHRLEQEWEMSTAPVAELYDLTDRMITKEFGRNNFSIRDLLCVVREKQQGYTKLKLQQEDAEASMRKVMENISVCVTFVLFLFLHRLAKRVHSVHKWISPIVGRFSKVNKKYQFGYWLFNKCCFAIAYPLTTTLAKLYGTVGYTNVAWYIKEKPVELFEQIDEASGESPFLLFTAGLIVAMTNAKTAHDVRTKEEKDESSKADKK